MFQQLQTNVVSQLQKFLTDKDMAKIKITQKRSSIGSSKRQKRTLEALGLKKLGRTVEHEDTPQIVGMVRKVEHLVVVENV